MKILICGFSGSGKSTWLASFNHLKFESYSFNKIDLDHFIANKGNVLPSNLINFIEKIGVQEFRKLEKECLKELIDRSDDLVISLGGGSLNEEVLEGIKKDPAVYLVFLDEDFSICLDRIKKDPNRLLSRKTDAELMELYQFRRENYYLKSDLTLRPSEAKKFEDLLQLVHTLIKLKHEV